jgi:hypothetical protein
MFKSQVYSRVLLVWANCYLLRLLLSLFLSLFKDVGFEYDSIIEYEWATWSENFLAKAKRSGIKDVLLGKFLIPISSEMFDEKTDEGKRMLRITVN